LPALLALQETVAERKAARKAERDALAPWGNARLSQGLEGKLCGSAHTTDFCNAQGQHHQLHQMLLVVTTGGCPGPQVPWSCQQASATLVVQKGAAALHVEMSAVPVLICP